MSRADLALVGFGHVGRRFARLIEERRARLRQEHDLECRIVGIATRRHGSTFSPAGVDVAGALARVERGAPVADEPPGAGDAFAVIAALGTTDAPMHVVVETTTLDVRAGQPAIAHVEAALDAGCHVVTANKGPAAFAYWRLMDRARSAGLSFLFESAVMDGVPVFNLVRESLPAVDVVGFRGVINATTNHILTALEDGEAFEPALARMQAEGIAEADASLDVDGWDAAAKTAALANVLLGGDLTPHRVDRTGIGPDSAGAARAAKSRGNRLRLVASAERGSDGEVRGRVGPVELPGDDLLAGLRGQANALVLRTDLLDRIAVCQLDGSLTQTAYGLLADIVTIRRRTGR